MATGQAFGFMYNTINADHLAVIEQFDKLAAYGTGVFRGDVVVGVAGVSGLSKEPINSWKDATPGTTIPLGVALDFSPASTKGKVGVIILEPRAEFFAQDNDPTTGILGTDIGKNANIDGTSVLGSALTGFSGMQIDKSGVTAVPSTSATAFELHLKKLYPAPDNAFGPHARVIVTFNKGRNYPVTVGV